MKSVLKGMRSVRQVGALHQSKAFTRTDLICVLGVAAILMMLHIPVRANSEGQSALSVCMSNLRRLTYAWQMYASDHNGKLVGNLDGGGVMNIGNSNATWVLGWMDFAGGNDFPPQFGGRAATNTLILSQLSPLAPYFGRDASVFKCPADLSLSRGKAGLPRVRSVSMNSYLGGRSGPFTAGYRQFRKLSEMNDPGPSRTFVFIDEREDSINDGWMIVSMAGFRPRVPEAYQIIDYPADWHNQGPNLSFADGHVEHWKWKDRRTMPKHYFGRSLPLGVASPNNVDVERLQSMTTSSTRR